MAELLSNITLWIPVSMVLIVQAFKVVNESVRSGKLELSSITKTGGMPSSHSAMVSSLATAVAFRSGMNSTAFAISVVLASIVIHDARGIRQESGKQAKSINRLMAEVFENPLVIQEELKERLGHTTVEVFYGTLTGIVYVVAIYYLLGMVPF